MASASATAFGAIDRQDEQRRNRNSEVINRSRNLKWCAKATYHTIVRSFPTKHVNFRMHCACLQRLAKTSNRPLLPHNRGQTTFAESQIHNAKRRPDLAPAMFFP
jgi:hypothetical protein